uniref:Uncharacterized protein n=1 Tax=Anguilla anguilla TaxID=7936 RepID=A0A0E9QDX6_ANGAN
MEIGAECIRNNAVSICLALVFFSIPAIIYSPPPFLIYFFTEDYSVQRHTPPTSYVMCLKVRLFITCTYLGAKFSAVLHRDV